GDVHLNYIEVESKMPTRIKTNDLPKGVREPVAQAISDAIGTRDGDWRVTVTPAESVEAWDVRIEGPDDFVWVHRFEGVERDPTILKNSIRVTVEMSVGELSVALSELVRQGISFTSERRSDGHTDYII